MSYVFHKLVFKKYKPDKVVTSIGGKAFAKLTIPATPPPPPLLGVDPDNLSLLWLNLKPGTYRLTATVKAPSLRLAESDRSNSVEYTVK